MPPAPAAQLLSLLGSVPNPRPTLLSGTVTGGSRGHPLWPALLPPHEALSTWVMCPSPSALPASLSLQVPESSGHRASPRPSAQGSFHHVPQRGKPLPVTCHFLCAVERETPLHGTIPAPGTPWCWGLNPELLPAAPALGPLSPRPFWGGQHRQCSGDWAGVVHVPGRCPPLCYLSGHRPFVVI